MYALSSYSIGNFWHTYCVKVPLHMFLQDNKDILLAHGYHLTFWFNITIPHRWSDFIFMSTGGLESYFSFLFVLFLVRNFLFPSFHSYEKDQAIFWWPSWQGGQFFWICLTQDCIFCSTMRLKLQLRATRINYQSMHLGPAPLESSSSWLTWYPGSTFICFGTGTENSPFFLSLPSPALLISMHSCLNGVGPYCI